MSLPAHLLLERVTHVAPFGVVLWDPALGRLVSEGLSVRVSPAEEKHSDRMLPARPNRAGAFVLHHLPGLRDFEAGTGDDEFWGSLPPTRRFRAVVIDTLGRYSPFVFHVDVPKARGFVRPECLDALWPADAPSPPGSPPTIPPYVILFSAPARPVPGGMTAVRATLRVAGTCAPAEHALLEVRGAGRLLGRGIADARGEVMAIVAYPEPPLPPPPPPPPSGRPPSGRPPRGNDPVQQPLSQQTWPLEISVRYRRALPSHPSPDPKVRLADLCDILGQPAATISPPSPPAAVSAATLEYGSELILGNGAEVFVHPSP